MESKGPRVFWTVAQVKVWEGVVFGNPCRYEGDVNWVRAFGRRFVPGIARMLQNRNPDNLEQIQAGQTK